MIFKALKPALFPLVLSLAVFFPYNSEARLLPLGQPFQVNTSSLGDQVYPRVAADDRGFVVLWESPDTENPAQSSISGAAFNANGNASGQEFSLPEVSGRLRFVVQGDSFVLAWFGDQGLTLGSFGFDGVARNVHLVEDVAFPNGSLSLANAPNGEVGLAWDQFGPIEPIRVQRFNPDDGPAGPSFVVTQVDPTNEYPHAPRIAGLPDRSFVVTWWAEASSALWGQRFDAEDEPLGDRFAIVDPNQLDDLISSSVCAHNASGNFTVAWHSYDHFGEFRRFGSTTTQLAPNARCTALGSPTSLACFPNDNLVLVGGIDAGDSHQIFLTARAFNRNDQLIGHLQLPLSSNAAFTGSATAPLTDKEFVIVWHDCTDGPAGCDIFGQRFTLTPTAECAGDCNLDGRVTVDELVTGVNIALLQQHIWECGVIDKDSDCRVGVSELVSAVARAQRGCQ